MHWLLKDTPARRRFFRSVTGDVLMSLRFCKTRLTEHFPLVELAIEMLPQLRQYVKAVQESKVFNPKTKSFDVVKESCNDSLMEPKLSFYRSVDKQMKPFLTLCQTDKTDDAVLVC